MDLVTLRAVSILRALPKLTLHYFLRKGTPVNAIATQDKENVA